MPGGEGNGDASVAKNNPDDDGLARFIDWCRVWAERVAARQVDRARAADALEAMAPLGMAPDRVQAIIAGAFMLALEPDLTKFKEYRVPKSTLDAAEWLYRYQYDDTERFLAWLHRHPKKVQLLILKHLEKNARKHGDA